MDVTINLRKLILDVEATHEDKEDLFRERIELSLETQEGEIKLILNKRQFKQIKNVELKTKGEGDE